MGSVCDVSCIRTDARYERWNPLSAATVRLLGAGVGVGETISDGVLWTTERGGRAGVDDAAARVDELGALEAPLPARCRLVVVVVVDDVVATPRRYHRTQRCNVDRHIPVYRPRILGLPDDQL